MPRSNEDARNVVVAYVAKLKVTNQGLKPLIEAFEQCAQSAPAVFELEHCQQDVIAVTNAMDKLIASLTRSVDHIDAILESSGE